MGFNIKETPKSSS